jgi:fructokinase
MESEQLYGGVEAGGTKFICAIGSGPGQISSETRIATTSPDETLRSVVDFFRLAIIEKAVTKVGVACFGPLDLEPRSGTYGFITSTPKPGWRNTDITGRLQSELGVRVVLDTDVNGAALAESVWGAGKGYDPLLYLTIGTGIGGGYVNAGQTLKGLIHPEMGHIRIPHNLNQDPFPGNCPFHGDCFEGLASGPALQTRFGRPGTEIPDGDPFWQLESHYIALALQDFVLTLSPRKVILGGGIMQRTFLFEMIRSELGGLLNGYVQHPVLLNHLDEYVVPPMLGSEAGVLGAIALAKQLP